MRRDGQGGSARRLGRWAAVAATATMATVAGAAAAGAATPPPNDGEGQAAILSAPSGSTAGTNVGATIRSGEARSNDLAASVWWSWRAVRGGFGVFTFTPGPGWAAGARVHLDAWDGPSDDGRQVGQIDCTVGSPCTLRFPTTTQLDYDVRVATLVAPGGDPATAPTGPFTLGWATDDNDVQEPAVATSGATTMLAWTEDEGNGFHQVQARRQIDDAPIAEFDPTNFEKSNAAVAYAGGRFLVVFQAQTSSGAQIWGRFAEADRSSTIGEPFPISTGPAGEVKPSVAGVGDTFLVTWEDQRGGGSDIYGQRYRADSTKVPGAEWALGGPIKISGAPGLQGAPNVAGSATTFLVTWEDRRSGGVDLYSTRVSPAGVVASTAGVPIVTAAGDQFGPRAAWNPQAGQFLVTWADSRAFATANTDIYGVRVSGAGVVLNANGIKLAGGATRQLDTSVAPLGTGWHVAWSDPGTGGGDLFSTRVNANGTPNGPAAGSPMSTGPAKQQHPVAIPFAGQVRVYFEDVVTDPYDGKPAADIRQVIIDANGAVVQRVGVV